MPDAPRALMLFAAGLGTRMAPLTNQRPKPLVEVAGRALIDHALDQAAGQALERIVANTHYRAEQLEAHLAPRGVITLRETELLDTGGGLKNALPLLPGGAVFTLNTDAVWTGPSPLATLARHWNPARMDALLILVPHHRAHGHVGDGDFALAGDGRLRRSGDHVFGGAQIIARRVVEAVPARVFSLNRLWDSLAARGRLHGVVHPGGWCDVGRPDCIARAEALLTGKPDD
ncbi:MAG: nucleotidyltransferase family protein [Alphaproteobacteria bacterium]|nr:MAG: nucleotidyltransferase family protein [Alphaproteobacteria bacterium]